MAKSLRAFVLFLLAVRVTAAHGQEIRARVLDEFSRQPIAGATASLHSAGQVLARASTDATGFFRLKPGKPGEYEITVEILGHATQRRPISFAGQDLTVPAFVLKTEAVKVDPIEATARETPGTSPVVGASRASYLFSGSRLMSLEQSGASPKAAVREISGLRIREYKAGAGHLVFCVEAVRRIRSMRGPEPPCSWPVIVIDGQQVGDPANCTAALCEPEQVFRTLDFKQMESFEYMPPIEAGYQYGLRASSNGALVIWTRGRGPHRHASRDGKQE